VGRSTRPKNILLCGINHDDTGAYLQTPAIVATLSLFNEDKPIGAIQIYLSEQQITPKVAVFQKKKFINISPNGLVGTGVWLTKAKKKVLGGKRGRYPFLVAGLPCREKRKKGDATLYQQKVALEVYISMIYFNIFLISQ